MIVLLILYEKMEKLNIYILFFASLFFTPVYTGCVTNDKKEDIAKEDTTFWVIIGDSQAEGHPGTHGRLHPIINLNKDDQAGQLSFYLRQLTKLKFYNHGVGGETSEQVWKRWNRDVLAKKINGVKTLDTLPQGVVVIVGINDFYNNISVETLKVNLTNMAASCYKHKIRCVMLNLPGDEIINISQVNQIDQINAWLKSGALQQYNTVIVDFNTWWRNPKYNDNAHGNSLLVDDIHLSSQGYDSLAHYIFKEAKLHFLIEK